jgi:hypothetical protein
MNMQTDKKTATPEDQIKYYKATLCDCINEKCYECKFKPHFCPHCRWQETLEKLKGEQEGNGY